MSIPRAAIWHLAKVRVLDYLGRGKWLILDTRDQQRVVGQESLTFTK